MIFSANKGRRQRLILNLLIRHVQPPKTFTIGEGGSATGRRVQGTRSPVVTQKGDRERLLLSLGTDLMAHGHLPLTAV